MITKFKLFKEGLLSKMKPKTDEEFLNSLKELDNSIDILKYSIEEDFQPGIDLAFDRGLEFDYYTTNELFDSLERKHFEKLKDILFKEQGSNLSAKSLSVIIFNLRDKVCDEILNLKHVNITKDIIDLLLRYSNDKEKTIYKIIDLKGKDLNCDKPADNTCFSLIDKTTDPVKLAKILMGLFNNDLSAYTVYNFIFTSQNKEVAEIIGKENINKLSDKDIYALLYFSEKRNPDKIADVLIEYKDLSEENIKDILKYTIDKDKMVTELIKKGYKKK